MNAVIRLLLCVTLTHWGIGSINPARAEPAPKFPIVFDKMEDLQSLGLSLDWPPKLADDTGKSKPVNPPKFQNTCYWYAGSNTNYIYSLSDEYLATYTARGFTRESLCMALVSEAKFDPETGQRLPTYIYRDEAQLKTHLDAINPATIAPGQLQDFLDREFKTVAKFKRAFKRVAGGQIDGLTDEAANILIPFFYATNELPLRVPDCFKNGTPYTDCDWRYDMHTGDKLDEARTARIREVGNAANSAIETEIARGSGQRFYEYEDTSHSAYLLMDRVLSPGLNITENAQDGVVIVPVNEEQFDQAIMLTWCVLSPNLPRGYGYALYAIAEGFGDGGISAASLKPAFDPAFSSSRFSPARLKALLR